MKRTYVYLGIILSLFSAFFVINLADAEVNKIIIKPSSVYTIQPRLVTEEFMPPSTLQGIAQGLADKFTGRLSYADIYQYKDIITARAIQNLGANQIVLWRGHGSWDEANERPIILTGRDFNEEEAEEGVIVQDGFYEAITAEYIDRHANNLSGSLIYLNVCESAHNSIIIDAFLDKGAETVLGSTGTAEMAYSNNVQDMTVRLLGEVNPKTNNYYTISESLDIAKQEYGETDPGSGGEIVIFGNKNYRVGSIEPEPEPVVPSAPDTGLPTSDTVKI